MYRVHQKKCNIAICIYFLFQKSDFTFSSMFWNQNFKSELNLFFFQGTAHQKAARSYWITETCKCKCLQISLDFFSGCSLASPSSVWPTFSLFTQKLSMQKSGLSDSHVSSSAKMRLVVLMLIRMLLLI